MELENLKSHFNSVEPMEVSRESLLGMLNINQHPTLKGIRIQILIESTAWTIFLAFYYNFFDGHLKPVVWNVVLVISVGLMLVHNLLGHHVINNPISGSNIMASLERYIQRLKKYAFWSILSRVVALTTVFGFFLSGLENFEPRHYVSIGVFVIIVAVQALSLWKIWSKRIQTVASKCEQFTTGE